MITQYKLLAAMLLVALASSVFSTSSYAITAVSDHPLIKPYANAKRNCTGLTPLPNYCRFPRYYRVQPITGLVLPAALNDVGQVVGMTVGADHRLHAAVWSNGTVTDLGMLGCRDSVSICQSRARGINDLGQIVGDSNADDMFSPYHPHAFLWSAGAMTPLPELGPEWSSATDINDNGVIVGYGRASFDYEEHGWVNSDGRLTPIGNSGEPSRAYAVNEKDQVAGSIRIGSSSQGFFLSNETMTLFGGLGGPTTIAYDLNDAARPNVVGVSTNAENKHRAFLWRPGVMFDLGVLPQTDTSVAWAINNRGQIVGQSGDKAVIWQNGEMRDINHYLGTTPVTMRDAIDIDKRGNILAQGTNGAFYLLYAQY